MTYVGIEGAVCSSQIYSWFVSDGLAVGVLTSCNSRWRVAMSVPAGNGRAVANGVGAKSMPCVKVQAANSMNTNVETALEIFISVMLP